MEAVASEACNKVSFSLTADSTSGDINISFFIFLLINILNHKAGPTSTVWNRVVGLAKMFTFSLHHRLEKENSFATTTNVISVGLQSYSHLPRRKPQKVQWDLLPSRDE